MTDVTFPNLSVTGKHWHLAQPDQRSLSAIMQQHNLSEIMARLLLNRGVMLEQVSTYLTPTLKNSLPEPFLLNDMEQAVARTVKALDEQEKIVVYGDYDVDGATSSALLRRYFHTIGHPIDLYIPDRLSEGYGANADALASLHAAGQQLVIIVDSGSVAFDPLETAAKLGLDVIVLDHHATETKLPQTCALVNPNRFDQSLPETWQHLRSLCAAGVAFLFVVALQRALRQRGWFDSQAEPSLLTLLDLVALGTVCDVMPLVGTNRAFVSQGLKVAKTQQNQGLKALGRISGITESLSAYHLGFMLGPRINAGGRVGKSTLGSLLLSTDDDLQAKIIGEELNTLNQQRQEIEKRVLDDALNQVERENLHKNPLVMVGHEGWHPGVIGIVASRLKEQYNRPACVVAFDQGLGKGSGRSVTGVEMGQAMHVAVHKGLLDKGGGHAMAAGFTVQQAKYDSFYDFLNTHFAAAVDSYKPTVKIDGVLSAQGATEDFLYSLQSLEPFGTGNPGPKFAFMHMRVTFMDVVGTNHIRCTLADAGGNKLTAMAFRCVGTPLEHALEQSRNQPIHVVGTLKLDHWNNKTTVKFFLEDAMLL
jgi:single-stranded-DNA-specific exonuclease